MPHGDVEVDMEAELADGLPEPYCMSNWRQVVSGTALAAVAVLGVSIHAYTFADSSQTTTIAALRDGAAMGNAAMGPRGAAPPVVAVARTVQVGTPQLGMFDAMQSAPAAPRTAFNGAARRIRPSVVGIRVSFAPGANGAGAIQRLGSGVVVDPAGYVVTNYHVLSGAQSIVASRFRESDRELPAQLVAVEGDLALLKVGDQRPFEPAVLADSDTVEVGDWVLAVGHPFGLGLTVTAGIVGRRRGVLDIPGGQHYTGLLQTDAPINEGSSGGPLVNMNGEVVGLNTAIYAPTGVFSGAGFALTSNMVRAFVERHRPMFVAPPMAQPALAATSQPNATPGWGGAHWGMSLADLTPMLSAQLAYPQQVGVVVSGVASASPASNAQLAPGDVITAVAGQPVTDVNTLDRLQRFIAPDQSVSITVWRRGQIRTFMLQNPSSGAAG